MQIEVNFETWKECFTDLPDPRVEGWTLHRLPDILFMTLCGVICGMDDEEAIEDCRSSPASAPASMMSTGN